MRVNASRLACRVLLWESCERSLRLRGSSPRWCKWNRIRICLNGSCSTSSVCGDDRRAWAREGHGDAVAQPSEGARRRDDDDSSRVNVTMKGS
jgi:hypothetical protein